MEMHYVTPRRLARKGTNIMPRQFLLLLALLVVLCWTLPAAAQQSATNALSAAEAAEGWKLLFDGRTQSGWVPSGDADWRVEDGALTATKGTGFLVSADYADFELRLDFWAAPTVNSGIFMRCGDPMINLRTCYEVQIGGTSTGLIAGNITNTAPAPDAPAPSEQWNSLEISAVGDHLMVKLNGRTLVDARDKTHTRGKIALQEGGRGEIGLVRFRNIRIRTR
jgi:hypothetical protein